MNWFSWFSRGQDKGITPSSLPDTDFQFAADWLNGKDSPQEDLGKIDPNYELVEPFGLGTFETEQNRQRSRIDLYTTLQQMSADPTISACTRLKVTAALGGHESRGDVVFMTPSSKIRTNKNEKVQALRKQVEDEAMVLMPMLNKIAFTLAKLAVDYGDSYVRVRGQKGVGIVNLECNELTIPYNIQAYEQGGETVGYHVLENINTERKIAKLTTIQMARMKMPRSQFSNQAPLFPSIQKQALEIDDPKKLPIIPSMVGGSLILEAEAAWKNFNVLLGSMTNQQIADSVETGFLQLNHEGMTPSDRKKYMRGLTTTLQKRANIVRKALEGGDATWQANYVVLPSSSEKQALNPIGELSQRRGQITVEPLMIALRRLTSTMGIDVSLVGWADMLAGGLGDGAAFHTSARIMQDSVFIRQGAIECFNHLADLHFGWKYGVVFQQEKPWQFEFYSDMSAATTEALSNKQMRLNTLMLTAQSITTIKEAVTGEAAQMLLESVGGFDADQAEMIVKGFNVQPQDPSMTNQPTANNPADDSQEKDDLDAQ
jgi:hypothetical protein